MRTKSKNYRLALAILTLASALILLVVADFGLQWTLKIPSRFLKDVIRFDPSLAPPKRLRPNLDVVLVGALKEFTFHMTTNSDGFRRTTPYESNDNAEPSVILLGDSQTFGVGVNDEETIASFLSTELGKPVLNTGCPGYNNIEQYFLTNTLLKKYKPDYFILLFFPGNDPYENFTNRKSFASSHKVDPSTPSKRTRNLKFSMGDVKSYLIRHSALYYLSTLLRRIGSINEFLYRTNLVNRNIPNEIAVYVKHPTDKKDQFWTITENALSEMNRIIGQADGKLLISIVPDKLQVDDAYWHQWVQKYRLNPSEFNRFAPNEHLKQFSQKKGIQFLDLTPIFRSRFEQGDNLFWRMDHHLREGGNRVIAESLSDYLRN